MSQARPAANHDESAGTHLRLSPVSTLGQESQTTSPERALAGLRTDALRSCLHILGRRWALPVLVALEGGALRRGALSARIASQTGAEVSDKVLTEMLRDFAQIGVVVRKVFAAVPPEVEYQLSPSGAALVQLLLPLADWANRTPE